MRTLQKLIIGLAAIFLITGCVREDNTNCDFIPHQSIKFVFTYYGDGDIDIFSSKIDAIDLYVFDHDDRFVKFIKISDHQLQKQKGVEFSLPTGEYSVVFWGNATDHSSVVPYGDKRQDYILSNREQIAGEAITTSDPLYYAYKQISVKENTETKAIIEFTSAHIDFEVHFDGYDIETAENIPVILFHNILPGYDFKMQSSGQPATYTPEVINMDGKAVSEFSSTRFDDDNSITIDIFDTDLSIAFSFDFGKFCKDNKLSIRSTQELTIPIYVRFGETGLSVWVEDWNTSQLIPIV